MYDWFHTKLNQNLQNRDEMRFSGFLLHFLLFNVAFLNLPAQEVKDSVQLETVDIRAHSSDEPMSTIGSSVGILSVDDLQLRNDVTLVSGLNALPGVYMHSGTMNTNRMVIRGIGSRTPYSSNRIRAYLNDIPLTNGDGVTTIEDIDVSLLGRVEVMKGPSSALYGSGLGGTLKLYATGSQERLIIHARSGSFSTQQYSIGGKFGEESNGLSVAVNSYTSDGYRENNEYRRNSLFATGKHLMQKSTLSYTLLLLDMDAQIPSSINEETFENTPEKAANNWLSAEGYEENKRLISGVSLQHSFSDIFSSRTTVFAGISRAFEHRPFNDLADNSWQYGTRNQMRWIYPEIEFIANQELFFEDYNWQTEDEGEVLNAVKEKRWYYNISGLMSYQPLANLRITGALNLNQLFYNYTNENGAEDRFSYTPIFSPRLGVNYQFNGATNIYTSIGHGFSSPSLEETLLPDGDKNNDLQPEQGVMSELGFRSFGLNRKLYYDLTFYHINLQDLLVTKRITEESFMGINAGRTQHAGVELVMNYQLFQLASFPGKMTVSGSGTVMRNLFVDFVDEGIDYSGNQLPGIPDKMGHLKLEWEPASNLELFVSYNFFGSQFLDDDNLLRYNPYQVFDMSCQYQVNLWNNINARLKLGINNVFNEHYASMLLVNAPSFGGAAPRYYYPGMPRNYNFSLSLFF